MSSTVNDSRTTVSVLGCGDAFDPVYGNSSYLYTSHGSTILIDCGYQAVSELMKLTAVKELDAIIITHLHGDHYFGLPILLAWYSLRLARTKPLTIIGPSGLEEIARKLTVSAYPTAIEKSLFEISWSDISVEQKFRNLRIASAPVNHGPPTWAVAIADGNNTVAFSSDGSPSEEALRMYESANMLFHECYSEHSAGPAHFSFDEIEVLRERLKHLNSLLLVHIKADERAQIEARIEAVSGTLPRYVLPAKGEIIVVGE